MMYSILNGRLFPQGTHMFAAENLAFRSGVGLIESILLTGGDTPYWEAHYQRLNRSCEILKWPHALPEKFKLKQWLQELIHINGEAKEGTLRIQVFPDNQRVHVLMELLSLPSIPAGEKKVGMVSGVSVHPDGFSALKTSSRLVYQYAADQVKVKGWYDGLLLNGQGRVVESTVANIFWESKGHIYTPPLSEGCVAGVGRSMVLSGQLRIKALPVEEQVLSPEALASATAIWLVNAVRGVQLVTMVPV